LAEARPNARWTRRGRDSLKRAVNLRDCHNNPRESIEMTRVVVEVQRRVVCLDSVITEEREKGTRSRKSVVVTPCTDHCLSAVQHGSGSACFRLRTDLAQC
jgi:hypothetical protein